MKDFVPTKTVKDTNSPPCIGGEVRHLYLAKIEGWFKHNPKLFWECHKAIILHHRSVLNPAISHNNQIAKTSREKAELFNSYFCSVFRPVKTTSNPKASTTLLPHAAQLSDIVISEVEVTHHLSHLDPTKATGPDAIPGRILQECSSVIAPSLFTFQSFPKFWNSTIRMEIGRCFAHS